MSTIVVTPPAAAALVAVSKPSHSVRPGSLTWTCESTIPGDTTRSPASTTSPASTGTSSKPWTATIRPSMTCTDAGRSAPSATTRRPRTISNLPAFRKQHRLRLAPPAFVPGHAGRLARAPAQPLEHLVVRGEILEEIEQDAGQLL